MLANRAGDVQLRLPKPPKASFFSAGLEAERTFCEVGDGAFTHPPPRHPNQRMRACPWGADLASTAQKQGHILPSLTVADRFDDVLSSLVPLTRPDGTDVTVGRDRPKPVPP